MDVLYFAKVLFLDACLYLVTFITKKSLSYCLQIVGRNGRGWLEDKNL